MAKTKSKKGSKRATAALTSERDSTYVLKLVLYLIIGAQWIRLENVTGTTQVPIPIGLVIGLLFVMHDHFKIDRKIEYAILLVAMFVGFWTQAGVFVTY